MTSPEEIPSHRACAHCRSQKIRCIASENDPDTCQRCARSGRPCVFTPLQKRKQRKRTDTRVAELEREMRAMRAALKQKEESSRSRGTPGNEAQQRNRPLGLWFKDMQPDAPRLGQAANWVEKAEDEGPTEDAEKTSRNDEGSVPSLWPSRLPTWREHDNKDVIDKGLISMATARVLFDTYKNDLFPHYPMVVVTSSTADEMRQTKPILFLAIIAAAAGKAHSEISGILGKEILQTYATRSLVQSQKSLELVQALLVSAVWYHPPTTFGQLKYYEYILMAAGMAMDIGIGSRPSPHRPRPQSQTPRRAKIHPAEDVSDPDLSMTPRSSDTVPDTASIESRRTFLACYAICASVSLSLRRPNMLRVSSYIRDCVEFLETSPQAISTDRTVVAWVRLIMIADEISMSFNYDDSGNCASITELRTQLMLKDFSHQLTAWYASVPEADMGTGALAMMYNTIKLYLNEIALHVDHDSRDFQAPYQMSRIHPMPDGHLVPTHILAGCVAECITCAHSLFGTFLSMEPDSLRALPVFSYVRMSFAAFVLAKLCLSAAHSSSRIGKVIDRSSLKVESYMDRAILHVRNIVGTKRCRVPAIFLALLFKLRQWCLNPETIDQLEEEESGGAFDSAFQAVKNNRAIEAPRIVEQPSSTDTSPRNVSNVMLADASSEEASSHTKSHLTPEPLSANTLSANGGPMQVQAANGLMPSFSQPGSIPSNMHQPAMSGYEMDLDHNNLLFQYLGDINAFAAGGLTGLDDWAPMPDVDGMDYQQLGNDFGGPRGM